MVKVGSELVVGPMSWLSGAESQAPQNHQTRNSIFYDIEKMTICGCIRLVPFLIL